MKFTPETPLRKGDLLTVAAKVRFDYHPGDPFVHVRVGHSDCGIETEHVLELASREWEQGDVVRIVGTIVSLGEVVATCDGMVWVKTYTGEFATFASTSLEPVVVAQEPAEPEPPPEPEPQEFVPEEEGDR